MTDRYILKDGKPMPEPDIYKWGRWFESADRAVAKTTVSPDVYVSTVFLGIDHRFGVGPPMLWETMIFGGDHDQEIDRYTSLEDAKAGHEKMVVLAKGPTK